jgi:hypothetical protein
MVFLDAFQYGEQRSGLAIVFRDYAVHEILIFQAWQ